MIIIYTMQSGLSIWEKTFDVSMAKESAMFASFFSAIQNMVKEIVRGSYEAKTLKELNLGDRFVQITPIFDLQLEIITIADVKDRTHILNLHVKLTEMLKNHREMFLNWEKWDGDVSRFAIFNYEILNYVKKIFGSLSVTTLKEEQKTFLAELWKGLPDLEQKQFEQYRLEENELRIQLKNTINLIDKRIILEALDRCLQKIKNALAYEQNQKELKRITIEIEDTKKRAIYFLGTAKDALNILTTKLSTANFANLDFKDVYLNLYSFSTKLKLLGNRDAEKYRKWALQLIEKDKVLDFSTHISEWIGQIFRLSNDIESYLTP